MSRVPWHQFQDHQPRAHLVVGTLVQAEGPAGLQDSTAALAALRRLARQQKPASDYAATVIREAGRPELYFAFDVEADAQKFAASVKAEPTARHPGWASQRAFEMDGATIRELEGLFPPARQKGPPSYEARPLGRGRRGPRAPIRRYDEE
jgi:hypothetical protein